MSDEVKAPSIFDLLEPLSEALIAHGGPDIRGGFARMTGGVDIPFIVHALASRTPAPSREVDEPTEAMMRAGREQAVKYCVRVEDFQLRAIYTAMRQASLNREVVEAAARALYKHWVDENIGDEWASWEKLGDKESWRERAQAALSAIYGETSSPAA